MSSGEGMRFSADAARVLSEIRKVSKAQRDLERQIFRTSQAADAGSKEAIDGLQKQFQQSANLLNKKEELKRKLDDLRGAAKATYGGMADLLGPTALLGAMQRIIASQVEFNRQLAESARLADEQNRKFQVQALQGDEAFQRTLTTQLAPAAQFAGVPLATAKQVATELVSQGVAADQNLGSVVQEVLAASVASNQGAGEAPVEVAKSITGFLRSQGRDLNAANVRSVAAPSVSLFQGTAFQLSDLTRLSSIGQLLANRDMTQEDIFAAIGTAKQAATLPIEKATTSTKTIVSLLASAKSDDMKTDLLSKIGLKPEDVDFSGEDFSTVFKRLRGGVDSLRNPADRAPILTKLFGLENVAAGEALLGNIDMFEELKRVQGDTITDSTSII